MPWFVLYLLVVVAFITGLIVWMDKPDKGRMRK